MSEQQRQGWWLEITVRAVTLTEHTVMWKARGDAEDVAAAAALAAAAFTPPFDLLTLLRERREEVASHVLDPATVSRDWMANQQEVAPIVVDGQPYTFDFDSKSGTVTLEWARGGDSRSTVVATRGGYTARTPQALMPSLEALAEVLARPPQPVRRLPWKTTLAVPDPWVVVDFEFGETEGGDDRG